ncbi:hypothetical protein D2909_04355 [Planococcus salinarum]|nr:hypothetical protein D2909_04355 [Planococcus salinarum]
MIIMISVSCMAPAFAEDFGPSEWHQYRLNSENNPVYHSDFDGVMEETIDTNDEVRSTPVIVGNNVFIGNHNTGDIYSYDLVNEEMNWQAQAPNWIHSEIIHANDQLFVGFGNRYFQAGGTRGTGKSGLVSLDPESGEILWTFETEGEVMPTPAFFDNTVYITTGDRHLYAIDPDTGDEKWKLEIGHTVSMSSPNIKDGILYVGAGSPRPYTFSAVDLAERELVWQTELENVTAGLDDVPPAIHDNLVITTALVESDEKTSVREIYNRSGVMTTYKHSFQLIIGDLINEPAEVLQNHFIYAMDRDTGEVVWEEKLGMGLMVPNNKSGAPIVYDGKIFVGSPITKSFYAHDAETGEKLWTHESNVNKAPPVADGGIVYFTDAKGFVYAFNADNGELVGKKHLGGTLAPSGPVIMNDHLIVGGQDSNVYVLPTSDIIGSNEEGQEQSRTSNESSGSDFSYIFFIYIIPILVLVFTIVLIILVITRLRKTKKIKNDNSRSEK